MSHILNSSIEPLKSNFAENSISLIQISSPIPSDSSHSTYNAQNRDTQAEYLAIGKMVLRNSVKILISWTLFKHEEYMQIS